MATKSALKDRPTWTLHSVDGREILRRPSFPKLSLVLGRASLKAGLAKRDPFLSRQHAFLQMEGGEEGAGVFLVATHSNPCYVVRKDAKNIDQNFWDADVSAETLNEKSDGVRDRLQVFDGDAIRFSRDGALFSLRIDAEDKAPETRSFFDKEDDDLDFLTNSRCEAPFEKKAVKEDRSVADRDAVAATMLLGEDDDDDDEEFLISSPTKLSNNGVERPTLFSSENKISTSIESRNSKAIPIDDAAGSTFGVEISKNCDVAKSTIDRDDAKSRLDGDAFGSRIEKPSPKRNFAPKSSSTPYLKLKRRLPSWWMNLGEGDEKPTPKRAAPKKAATNRRRVAEETNELKARSTDDVERKESKAKPNQRVKTSKASAVASAAASAAAAAATTKTSAAPILPSIFSKDESLDQRIEAPPSTSTPSKPPPPPSSIFSDANLGTLASVLDDSPAKRRDEENNGGRGAGSGPPSRSPVKGATNFDDVDSWDEATPPTSPLNVSNGRDSASTPAKKRDSGGGAADTTTSTPKRPQASTSASSSGATSSKTAKRTKCPYGKDCYRKNPLHFVESCHPGDEDWEERKDEEEEEEVGRKPECEYGADCYRKNPQHRRDFYHPKPGERPKRRAVVKATKRKRRGDDEDDDEDDEYESSFINDDSDLDPDETFGTSTTSSEDDDGDGDDDDGDEFRIDDEEEDEEEEKRQLKRLKKEAKRFAKRTR